MNQNEWPVVHVERLRALWQAGHTASHIGELLGYSRSSVCAKVARIGLKRGSNPRAMRPARNPQPWSKDEKAALRRLWVEGKSILEIGEVLMRTPGAIGAQACNMGLTGSRGGALAGAKALGIARTRSQAALNAAPAKPEPTPDPGPSAMPEPAPAGMVWLPPRRCQFIAGEPTPDDACKCGAPAQAGSAYCPAHHARCWQAREPAMERVQRLSVLA